MITATIVEVAVCILQAAAFSNAIAIMFGSLLDCDIDFTNEKGISTSLSYSEGVLS